jgi:hypothetical protein
MTTSHKAFPSSPILGSHFFFQNRLHPQASEIARTSPYEEGKPTEPIQVLHPCYMEQGGFVLGDSCGHGKTRTAINCVRNFFSSPLNPVSNKAMQKALGQPDRVQLRTAPLKRQLLAIVPLSVQSTWINEIRTAWPEARESILLYHQSELESFKRKKVQKGGNAKSAPKPYAALWERARRAAVIVVTSETLTNSPHREFFEQLDWSRSALVIDEAHSQRKAADGMSEAPIGKKRKRGSGGGSQSRWVFNLELSRKFQVKILLTGTAFVNSLNDLYALMRFVDLAPGNSPDFWTKNATKPEVLFEKCLGTSMVRRRRRDADMCPLVTQRVRLPPTAMQVLASDMIEARRARGERGAARGLQTNNVHRDNLSSALLLPDVAAMFLEPAVEAAGEVVGSPPRRGDARLEVSGVRVGSRPADYAATLKSLLGASDDAGDGRIRPSPPLLLDLDPATGCLNALLDESGGGLERILAVGKLPVQDLRAQDRRLPPPHEPLHLTKDGAVVAFKPPPHRLIVASSAKLQWLMRLAPVALERDEKILVFSRSVKFLKMMAFVMNTFYEAWHAERDPDAPAPPRLVMYYGEMSQTDADDALCVFQTTTSRDCPLMLASSAAEEGIKVTAAAIVVTDNSDYNPQNSVQGMSRARRKTNRKPVRCLEVTTELPFSTNYLQPLRQRKLAHADLVVGGILRDNDAESFDAMDGETLRALVAGSPPSGPDVTLRDFLLASGKRLGKSGMFAKAIPEPPSSASVRSEEAGDLSDGERKRVFLKARKRFKARAKAIVEKLGSKAASAPVGVDLAEIRRQIAAELPSPETCRDPRDAMLGFRAKLTEAQMKEFPVQDAGSSLAPFVPGELDAAHTFVRNGRARFENVRCQDNGVVETTESRTLQKTVSCLRRGDPGPASRFVNRTLAKWDRAKDEES